MNNALISPNEYVYSDSGELLGERIAQTEQTPFEVSLPLFWIECADEVIAWEWYYDATEKVCKLIIQPQSLPNAGQIVY